MSYRACRDEGINRAQTIFAGLVIAGLALAGGAELNHCRECSDSPAEDIEQPCV